METLEVIGIVIVIIGFLYCIYFIMGMAARRKILNKLHEDYDINDGPALDDDDSYIASAPYNIGTSHYEATSVYYEMQYNFKNMHTVQATDTNLND
jgi:Na+(H+)/acetate symporter ActP